MHPVVQQFERQMRKNAADVERRAACRTCGDACQRCNGAGAFAFEDGDCVECLDCLGTGISQRKGIENASSIK